jgi:hypothetical protein
MTFIETNKFVLIPTSTIPGLGVSCDVVKISCGYFSTAVLTSRITNIGNNEIYVTGSIKQSSEFTRIDLQFTSKIIDLQPSFYTHFIVTGMLDVLIYSHLKEDNKVYEIQAMGVYHIADQVETIFVGGYHLVIIFRNFF